MEFSGATRRTAQIRQCLVTSDLFIRDLSLQAQWCCPAHPIGKPGGFLGNKSNWLSLSTFKQLHSSCRFFIFYFIFCSCLLGSEVHTQAWVGFFGRVGGGGEVDSGDEDFKIIYLGTRGGYFYWNRKKSIYDFALLGKGVVSWGRMLSGKGAKQQWCEDLEVWNIQATGYRDGQG